MNAVEGYRYMGLATSAAAWLAILVVLYKWPIVKTNSISMHVSAYKRAWLVFAPLQTLALALLYIFMVKWFIPVLGLPKPYQALVVAVVLLELVTTWVPDTDGWKGVLHHYTAYAAALLLPVLTAFVAVSPHVTSVAKVVAGISLGIMAGILCLYMTIKTTCKRHLVYQSIYFACYHLPILAVIFTAK